MLATALEAKGEDLSLVFVQQALVNEEQKRQVSKERAAAGIRDSVLQVDKPGTPFKGKCYKCKKECYKASECYKKKSTKFRHSHRAKAADDEDDKSELFVMKTGQMMTGTGQKWILDPQSINQSNFYSANIPGKAKLSGVTAKSVFNSKTEETVP